MSWVILDYVDVVAHVFHRESRTFYNLERLWADAKTVGVTDDEAKPEKMRTARRVSSATGRRAKTSAGAKKPAPKRRRTK